MLRQTGLRSRLKSSWIHDVYWMITDKKSLEIRQVQVEFYRALLDGCGRGDLSFDIGANEGAKTDVFLRLGANVVAVEPDELNQEVLKNRFLDYRLGRKSVVIVGKAVSDKSSVECAC